MDITYQSQVKISNQKLAASKRTKETNPKQGFYYEEMFECSFIFVVQFTSKV